MPEKAKLTPQERSHVAAGSRVRAMQMYRERTGCGLAEAKAVVEAHWERIGGAPPDPNRTLAIIAAIISEPLECGHDLQCWDEDRDACVWCERDEALAEVAKLRAACAAYERGGSGGPEQRDLDEARAEIDGVEVTDG